MKPICVFGVFVADLCFVADAIPEKGQTILGNKHIVGPGGKGSNQAIAAARLGGSVNFITKIGKDQNADMALSLYRDERMHTECIIQDDNHLTGVAGIMINEKTGDNAINIVPGAAANLTNEDIDNNLNFIQKSEIFLTQLETPYEVTSYALKKAKELKLTTIFNPAPASSRLFISIYKFLASSTVFPTAFNPPVHVLFLGTKPIWPWTGTPALASISILSSEP